MPAKGRRVATKQAAGPPKVTDVVPAGIPDTNTAHLSAVNAAMEKITNHPFFADIQNLPPLGIGNGGYRGVFNAGDCKMALQHAGRYEAGLNMFTVRWEYSAVKGTPINAKSVADLQKQFFHKPVNKFPADIVIAVDNGASDVMVAPGSLLRVSPPELEHAFFLSVAADIEAGKDEETLGYWKVAMLTCSFCFEVLETEEQRFYRHITLREQITGKHDAMTSTATQRVFQIMSLWTYKENTGEKQNNADFAQAWNSNVEMAASSEPVSESFIKTAHKVWSRALSREAILPIILDAEGKYGKQTPFLTLSQIEAYIDKTRSEPTLAFCVRVVMDLIDNSMATGGEFSVRNLTGKNMNTQNKGTLDLLVYKHAVMEFITGEYAQAHAWCKATTAALSALQTHAGYRKNVGKVG